MKKTEKKVTDSKANGRLKSVLAMILVSCVVIGLLSSTAIKLASATLLMKNTAIKSNNPFVQQLGEALNIPVEPATPVTPTPSTGTSSSSSSSTTTTTAASTTVAPTTTEEAEDTTDAPATQAPETEAPETEAPETEGTTVDPIVIAKQNQKVLKNYVDVVARGKLVGAQPSFVKTTTRTGKSPLSIIDDKVVDGNPNYFVSNKSIAVPAKTVSTELCINNEKFACLLNAKDLDVVSAAVKSASKETLRNGNVKIVITLNDEVDPTPIAVDSKESESFTAAMFPVISADEVRAMADNNLIATIDKASLTYTDCTVELVYKPATGEIVSLKQVVNYDATLKNYKLTVTEVNEYATFVY